jgi:hypothetical protein
MRRRLSLYCFLITAAIAPAIPMVGGLAAAAQTAPTPAPAPAPAPIAASQVHRVELPGAEGKPFPYTVEIPVDWQVREVKGIPGIWLGPHGAEPPNDPRLIYVRISQVSLADPGAVAAAIRANDSTQAAWSAPLVEVREVGGVRGVWVRMDSGEGEAARSTLTLKLPVGRGSVDFLSSAPRARFEELRPQVETILASVRPLAVSEVSGAADAPAAPPTPARPE